MAECRRFGTASRSEFTFVPCDVIGLDFSVEACLPAARKEEASVRAMAPASVDIIWQLRSYQSRVSFNRPQQSRSLQTIKAHWQ